MEDSKPKYWAPKLSILCNVVQLTSARESNFNSLQTSNMRNS